MAAARLLISCRSCRRSVALVPNVNTAALVVLANHLRCLHSDEAPGEQPTPKELLRRFRIAANEPFAKMERRLELVSAAVVQAIVIDGESCPVRAEKTGVMTWKVHGTARGEPIELTVHGTSSNALAAWKRAAARHGD